MVLDARGPLLRPPQQRKPGAEATTALSKRSLCHNEDDLEEVYVTLEEEEKKEGITQLPALTPITNHTHTPLSLN